MKRVICWLGVVLLLGALVVLGFGYHPAPALPVATAPVASASAGPVPTAGPAPTVAPTSTTPPSLPSSEAAFEPGAAEVLTIPRFGADYRKEIVEGTDPAQLGDTDGPTSAQNIGHYIGSAAAGQPGNFAIIGHRNPGVMADIDKLETGDIVNVGPYTYKVISPAETLPYNTPAFREAADEVLDPVPFDKRSRAAGFVPTQRLMTITSCGKYGETERRLAVILRLVD